MKSVTEHYKIHEVITMTNTTQLEGKKIAILAAELFEDTELTYPYYRLQEAGAEVTLIGLEKTSYTSKHGYSVDADVSIDDVQAKDFDGVVIPGGYAPDKLRRHESVLEFVRNMDDTDGMIAAICHAGWVPISAGITEDRDMTCYHAIKDDVINSGANYHDEPVVIDGNFITSRSPDDLPHWLPAIITHLAEKQVPAEAAEPIA
jgi:protease I